MEFEHIIEDQLNGMTYRQELRNLAGDVNTEGGFSGNARDMVMRGVAWLAEEILVEYFGSRDYGYTITTTNHDEKIILKGMYRNSPELMDGELWQDYQTEVGFAEEGYIRQYKGEAADWLERRAVEVATEARQIIDRHEMQEQR